ncbi:MAG TPA: 4-hydroxy-tetrahydrodipicolinate synthase [Actinomycetota bacterium]|nr:4-hydroxy-tetrahydrodipicolinate synthase [Actinomycetota bacterium]
MKGQFGGLLTAMVTPFDRDGRVDLGGAEKLAAWLIDNGSDGLVITGTTGESPTVTDAEKVELWRAVVGAVGDRSWVIAGTGSNDTAHSIELTAQAEKAGCHAALVVTPYYNRPPQAGLVGHFKAVASATALPIVVYDIPSRTGRKVEHRTLLALADVENIVAVKDACGDVQGAARLVAEAPESFEVYCGNDADTLPWLAVGARGVIAVASHVAGLRMAEMMNAFWAGEVDRARILNAGLIGVYDAMSVAPNPISVKAAVGMLGHAAGAPRLPLTEATAEEAEKIRRALASAGLL